MMPTRLKMGGIVTPQCWPSCPLPDLSPTHFPLIKVSPFIVWPLSFAYHFFILKQIVDNHEVDTLLLFSKTTLFLCICMVNLINFLCRCTQKCPHLKFTISINHHEMGNVMLPFGIYQRKQFILTESSLVLVKTRHHRGEWDRAKRSGEQLPEIISPGQVIRYQNN